MARELAIQAFPHPFGVTPQLASAPEGMSLAEIIGDAHDYTVIEVEGELIPREQWPDCRPRSGQVITIRALPAGDSETWRIIGQILITIAAIYTGGAIGGLAGAAASAGIAIGGTLLLNAILPPAIPTIPEPLGSGQRLPGLTGTRNAVTPYGMIPRLYGRMRTFPIMVKPVTEIIGNDQYLRTVFLVGVGDYELSDIKIGETSVENFADIEIFVGDTTVDSDYGGVVTTDDPLDLYRRDVDQQPLSIVLTSSSGGVSATQTTTPDAVEIGIDLTAPIGLRVVNKDESHPERRPVGVIYNIEFAPTGTNAWVNAANTLPRMKFSSSSMRFIDTPDGMRLMFLANTFDTVRVGITWRCAPGQYDVRVTPVGVFSDRFHNGSGLRTADFEDLPDEGYGPQTETWLAKSIDTHWTALRTWHNTPAITSDLLPYITIISLRIRATDQLNNVVDSLNLIATAKVAAFNGVSWDDPAASRNPAWAYVQALTGPENPRRRSLDEVNAAEILDWANWCDTNGYYYDARGDAEKTVEQIMHEATAAGRAFWTIRDGLYTVIRDDVDDLPVQMFTPRNSSNFRGTKMFIRPPHALKVRFINPAIGYQEDELIVYDDGYSAANATRFEILPMMGVTDADQAWRLARFHMAQARLRPEVYTLDVDFEHLRCPRGARVRVAHDVPLWGSDWARVKSVVTDGNGHVTQFVSDAPVAMDGISTYYARVRKGIDADQVLQQIVTVTGETSTIEFTAPVPDVSDGDLFVIGLADQETVELKVQRVTMRGDLGATLRLVDAADAIHEAHLGEIPPYDSQITVPLELSQIRPPQPTITNVQSDETVMFQNTDGSYAVRAVVTYIFSVQVGLPNMHIEARYRSSDASNDWYTEGPIPAKAGHIDLFRVNDRVEYEIQVRTVNGGLTSDWSNIYLHTIVGKSTPPPPVTNFRVRRQSDGTREYSWTYELPPKDAGGFRIYARAGTGHTKDTMDLIPGAEGLPKDLRLWENNQLTAGQWTVAITAIDTAVPPNESTAEYIEEDLGPPRVGSSIHFVDVRDEGWPGNKTNCFVDNNNWLLAKSQDTWEDLPDTWDAWNEWNTNPYTQIIYEHPEIDLGAAVNLTPVFQYATDSNVTPEMDTSLDGVTYTGWTGIGPVYCRYVKLRAVVDQAGSEAPELRALTINLSAEPVEEDLPDIDCANLSATYRSSAGVIRLPITKTYAAFHRFNFTIQDTTPGWSWILKDKTSATAFSVGPQFEFYKDGVLADPPLLDAYVKGV